MQPYSCAACVGPCMQVSIHLEKIIYGFQMFFAAHVLETTPE